MYRNILVTVDLGEAEAEKKAIMTAVELARFTGANLHVLTVVPDYGLSLVGGFFPKDHEKQAIEHANKALHDYTKANVPADVKHRHIVGHGSIYREILHYAAVSKADLIVLMASKPGPENYLLGPNAARVARHADVSVHVVR